MPANYRLITDATGQDIVTALQALVPSNNDVWTATVSRLTGDTSVTFTNAAIATTSILDLYSENTSGTPINYTGVSVSSGTATFTIPALTEATNFKLWIRNL